MAYFREQLRFSSYDEIYISPHMDDVAYSAAGRILKARRDGQKVLVVTLFGTGDAVVEKPGKSVFADYAQRSTEELAVMAALDADFIWLNYPELLFRPKSIAQIARFALPVTALGPSSVNEDMFAALLALFVALLAPGGRVYFPLGVGFHPDHRIVMDVGRAFHALAAIDVIFYEDVPYSIVPAFVTMRLDSLGVPARAGLIDTTRTVNQFLFRSLGRLSGLTLPVLWLYFAGLRVVQTLFNPEDRMAAEPAPAREVIDIADVVDEKVAVMRLYPSQTAFFFEMDERLYDFLRRDGGFFEYFWRFPAFDAHSERLASGMAEAAQQLRGRLAGGVQA